MKDAAFQISLSFEYQISSISFLWLNRFSADIIHAFKHAALHQFFIELIKLHLI